MTRSDQIMSRLPKKTSRLPVTLTALAAALLVGLVGLSRAQSVDHLRRLPLEGAPNVRDIGGYATTDGRHVKWRQVYRSGSLGRLTNKDYEYLAGVGIAVVCDFRNEGERRAAPTTWQGPNPPELIWLPATPDVPSKTSSPSARALIANGAPPEEVAASMRASYERYVEEFAASYGAVLQHILRASGPTLYHCSAGKDRTGTFTALLLRMLGVPLETVFEDYLLTNRYFGTDERIASLAKDLKTSPETARPMYVADRSYLEAAFQAIDRTYGSFDNYRRTALKLLDADLERLKARLLED
jgi:protein-tyrosine phosphatase